MPVTMRVSPWFALGVAAVAAVLTGGNWNVPVAAWFGPALLLYFTRSRPAAAGYVATAAVLAFVAFFAWRGQVPVSLPVYLGFAIAVGASTAAPYLADRLLGPRVGGFAATLVFPLAMTATELAVAAISPYGVWGSLAHTQFGNLPLMQSASVIGTWGVTFLICWFNSTLAWAWRLGFSPERAGKGALICLAVLTAAFAAGAARLALTVHGPGAVRIASITEPDGPAGRSPAVEAFERITKEKALAGPELESLRRKLAGLMDTLFSLTLREARAGARIVTWSEGAGWVLKEDEPALLRRAAAVAKAGGIYLAMPLVTVHPRVRRFENKVVLFTPQGGLAWQHHKARPVPGLEAPYTLPGDSTPKYLDTPYGRIAALICFDADFPEVAHKLGRAGVDILLLPSSDWREIVPLHSQIAVFRGLENGFSIVRQAREGLSLATDPYGRVLAAMDHFTTKDRALVAYVPTRGVRTVYARISPGAWPWLTAAAFLGLGGLAWRRSRPGSNSETADERR